MKGPIAQGTIRTTGVLGLRLVAQAGTLLLVARMLGPHQFGAFAGVAALAVMLGTLSTFGTHLVLLGEVSREPARRVNVLSYALPLTLLCGGALLAIYLLVCTITLYEAGVSLLVLLSIGVTETLLQPLLGLCVSEHHGIGRIARSQLLQILPLGLRLAAAATVFKLNVADPLTIYGYSYLVASLIALAIALTTVPTPWPTMKNWRFPRKEELRDTAGYAVANITKAGPMELDKTLATKLLPLAAAGVFAVGARVMGAIILPITAMTLSALPRLFREGQNQTQRTGHLLRWMCGVALGYGIALAGILWLIAPVFGWVFGSKYQGLDLIIRWLCIAIPGMTMRLTVGNVLMALGKPWMRVSFEVCGLVALIVASMMLTMHIGTIGMPIALACSEWTMAALGIAMLYLTLSRSVQSISPTPINLEDS